MELGHAIQDLGGNVYRFEPGPDGRSVEVAAVYYTARGWLGRVRADASLHYFPSREDAIRWLDAPKLEVSQ